MKKFTFTATPALSKNLTHLTKTHRNEINYPSVLLLLSPIFFSLDALFSIFFNMNQNELLLKKIIEIFLHLFLMLSFFILKRYDLSSTGHNIVFLFVRTCHLIVLMESEEWKEDSRELRTIVNGIKLSYLELLFFFLFNSSKFFLTSLISNFAYIGIRLPTNFLIDYFRLLLLFFAIFSAILILGREKKTKYFFVENSKASRLKKALSFKNILDIFPENSIDYFLEEIEEGVVIFDDEFKAIKQNNKFTDLLNKIGKENPLEDLFGAELTALKEGTEDLKSWFDEKNFTIAVSKSETNYRNNEFSPNSGVTLLTLLAQVFPNQVKNLNPCLKNIFVSSQTTMNIKNVDNVHHKMEANDIKVK